MPDRIVLEQRITRRSRPLLRSLHPLGAQLRELGYDVEIVNPARKGMTSRRGPELMAFLDVAIIWSEAVGVVVATAALNKIVGVTIDWMRDQLQAKRAIGQRGEQRVEILWGPDQRVLKRVVLDDPDGEPTIEDVAE